MEFDNFIKNKEIDGEEDATEEVKEWKRYIVTTDSFFFPVFQSVIKQVEPGKESVTINVINKIKSMALKQVIKDTFKLEFSWYDEECCGIEVFKKMEE